MKIKKLAGVIFIIAVVAATSSLGMAARRPPVSMLVVPARYTIIQISHDILAHRPSVLVSYQNTGELYVWDGFKWIPIRMSDLASVNFVRREPAKIVCVGDLDDLGVIIAATKWCDDVEVIEDMQTTLLLNDFGRIFNFSPAEWNWFAARYGCELNLANREDLGRSWYDQSGSEFLEREQALKVGRELELPPAAVVADEEGYENLEDAVAEDELIVEEIDILVEPEDDPEQIDPEPEDEAPEVAPGEEAPEEILEVEEEEVVIEAGDQDDV